MLSPPGPEEVEAQFIAVLSGHRSRDEADRWAAHWVCLPDPPDMSPAVWDALTKLFGCDLPDLDGSYLHSDDQIAEWLADFRATIGGQTG